MSPPPTEPDTAGERLLGRRHHKHAPMNPTNQPLRCDAGRRWFVLACHAWAPTEITRGVSRRSEARLTTPGVLSGMPSSLARARARQLNARTRGANYLASSVSQAHAVCGGTHLHREGGTSS